MARQAENVQQYCGEAPRPSDPISEICATNLRRLIGHVERLPKPGRCGGDGLDHGDLTSVGLVQISTLLTDGVYASPIKGLRPCRPRIRRPPRARAAATCPSNSVLGERYEMRTQPKISRTASTDFFPRPPHAGTHTRAKRRRGVPFRDSYGFRPGRGPHDALDALSVAITSLPRPGFSKMPCPGL